MSIKALTSRRAAIAAAVGVLGLGAYSVQTYFSRSSIAEADNPPKTFGGRLGFASLPLHSAEIVNHNTKRVVFKLPEKNAQSGLSLTCVLLDHCLCKAITHNTSISPRHLSSPEQLAPRYSAIDTHQRS